MLRRTLLVVCSAAFLHAAVPTPAEHLGHVAGADYKLADYGEISGYFRKLAASSDRIRVAEFGKSSEGRPMLVAFLSSPENLKQLDRYREISRRMALGRATAAEAQSLANEGKAIVWIDSGLHATEVAPAQHAPELAYRVITDESPEAARIRRNVILMQIPCINPDGLDMVSHWYRKNVGTPYEMAPLPTLYQKYAGHDNNRDWFMLNLPETRAVSKLLFHDWFPQIVYNQHQQSAFPSRIFVPPYAEPLNPNIPAAVMEGINKIGAAMKERFALEEKPGILSYLGYDAWWNGGLRSVPAFHNMHGILTETAASGYATPRTYDPKTFPRTFANGMPTMEPSVFYERPWMGGTWTLRDAVEYMLTADFAILNLAAQDPASWLHKAWKMARANIEAGDKSTPYAYVVPANQRDLGTAADMLERMAYGGIDVERAKSAFTVGEKTYPAGSWVMRAGQPFRGYLVDLMDPHKYPEIRTGQSGPTKRPYDVAGWTLPMLMGVESEKIADRFTADLEPAREFKAPGSVGGKGSVFTLTPNENGVFHALPFFFGRGEKVRWAADGTLVIESAYVENPSRAENFARQYGLSVTLRENAPAAAYELRPPRVAIYEPSMPNMDAGWTQFVFDKFGVPFQIVRNADLQAGDLRSRFDTIVLASQTADSILHGVRPRGAALNAGEGRAPAIQRPEYTGGIGLAGAALLEKFVKDGGTLVALDDATDLPIRFFGLPVRNVVGSGDGGFYSPGSLLRMTADPKHPAAFGMPAEFTGFSSGGHAFEITIAPEQNNGEAVSIVKYADRNLLASGWLSGERQAAGRSVMVECKLGQGRVLLYGFRPQFRGQPHATFRLLLNAIYYGSAQKL